MIPQDIIDEIRKKNDIVEVISEYLSLEQRGKNFFALCPFHDDHNPSMSISRDKQIYTCFVCNAHGNVFTFLMDYENISFIESVKLLGNKVGIKIDTVEKKEKKFNEFEEKLYDINDITNKIYQNNLRIKQGLEALNYLKDRGIDDSLIKEFEIGLSIDSNVLKVLQSKYNNELLIKSGIINENLNEIFTNRIIFPIYDINNKISGFSGRLYNRKDSSKYINSKENEIFKKGTILYNYNKCKEDVRRKKQLIITEGFMDVISLYKHNIKNVIATMGTAITKEHINLIKRLSNNVLLCFDGDEAGTKATIGCIDELVKFKIYPKVINIDEYDPDDYIKKYGVKKFEIQIEEAISHLDFKILQYKKNTNFENTNEVSIYINNVINELNLIDDKLVKEIIIKNLSNEVKVSINTLNKMLQKEKKDIIIEQQKEIKYLDKYEKAEMRLLYYMLRHEEVITIYKKDKCYFPTKEYRYLCNEILFFFKKYNRISIADFISFIEEKKEMLETMAKINSMSINEKYTYEEIQDYIDLLNNLNIENEIKRLTSLFKQEISEEKKVEIAKKISELKASV